ncbi:MAG: hypothetical protein CMB52_05575 [Euryarchaeota archaeon]|nr:hypothetical protein [Euryarchaeota archaeon]MBJ84967.1 hypothetical protein [Euryarchaeota archaeon]
MKVGDIVKYTWPDSFNEYRGQSGIILEINQWVDRGAPDRNFGIDVKVLWSNGKVESFDESELDLVSIVSEAGPNK